MGTPITIVGNLTDAPELRFTPSGAAVANFKVAVNERVKNKQTDEWEDGDTTYFKVSAWRGLAENVAESLDKGMQVIVQGTFKGKNWETNDGKRGTDLEITADAVGPSLKYATARVSRVQRNNAQGGGQQNGGQQGGWGQQGGGQQNGGQQGGWGQQGGAQPVGAGVGASDPWAAPTAGSDEPPF